MKKKVFGIGLMSGTSLDGLDVCYVRFDDYKTFEILYAQTILYEQEMQEQLKKCKNFSAEDLQAFDVVYGYFLGNKIKEFIQFHAIEELDFVASHGHTVFHQPNINFTLQIGHGAAIKSFLDCPVVCDFRSQDVILGGQGAPLVPFGDMNLFSEYDACLNLGGFSNISFQKNQQRVAFDISPFNTVLNYFAQQLNYNFDENGRLASTGKIEPSMLSELNQLAYYQQTYPKSLGYENLIAWYFPIFERYALSVPDFLHTFSVHVAEQIVHITQENSFSSVLLTGGGALNTFFVELLQTSSSTNFILPEKKIIDYKEALIFAYLGWMKLEGKVNCLSSVTGANIDHSSGLIYS